MDRKIEQRISQLAINAPELKIRTAITDQPFSWDAETDEPISMAEYLRDQAPNLSGIELLAQASEISAQSRAIRPVNQLTANEIRKLTLLRLVGVPPEQQHSWSTGDSIHTYQEIIESAQQGSGVGIRFLEADESHLLLLQSLISAGKVRIVDEPAPTEFKIPDSPF